MRRRRLFGYWRYWFCCHKMHVANSTKCNCIFTVLVRYFFPQRSLRTVRVRYSGRERTVAPCLELIDHRNRNNDDDDDAVRIDAVDARISGDPFQIDIDPNTTLTTSHANPQTELNSTKLSSTILWAKQTWTKLMLHWLSLTGIIRRLIRWEGEGCLVGCPVVDYDISGLRQR